MNFNVTSKKFKSEDYKDEQYNNKETQTKQTFDDSKNIKEKEDKTKNEIDISTSIEKSYIDDFKHNFSIRLIKIILIRKLRAGKKLYLNKWRGIIFTLRLRENNFNRMFIVIKKYLMKNILNRILYSANSTARIENFLTRIQGIFKNEEKIFFLTFFSRVNNFSIFSKMRSVVYKNLLNRIDYKKGVGQKKKIIQKWKISIRETNKEIFKKNYFNLENVIKKIYSKIFLTQMKKISMNKKKEEKFFNLIKKRILFKKFYLWNYKLDYTLIERKIKRRKIQMQKLKRILDNYVHKSNQKLKIFFLRWKILNQKLKFFKPARIIQKFMIYADVRRRHMSLYKNVSREYQAVDSIFNFIQNNFFSFSFNKIKNESKRRIIIDFVLTLRKKNLENLKLSFEMIKKFARMKFIQKNKFATRIQSVMKKIFVRKKILSLIFRIKNFKNLLNGKPKYNRLRRGFITWKDKSNVVCKMENSKILQNYFKKKIANNKKKKTSIAKQNLNLIFWDFLKFRRFKPFFRNFIKSARLKIASDKIKIYLFKVFWSNCEISNLNLSSFKLNNLLQKIKTETNLNSFREIKNFSITKWKNLSANKIQNYFRYKHHKMRRSNIKINLSILMNRIIKKNRLSMKFILTTWKRNSKNFKLLKNANIISNFLKKKMINLKWKKFVNFYKHRENRKGIRKFVSSLIKIKTFYSIVNNVVKLSNFNNMKKNLTWIHKLKTISRLIKISESRNKINSMKISFTEWNMTTKLYNKIQSSFEKISSLVTRKNSQIILLSLRLNYLNNSYKTLKLKKFIKLFKINSNEKNIIKTFGQNIIKVDLIIEKYSKSLLRDKIYKLFTYKILSSFMNSLNKKFYDNTIKHVYDSLIKNLLQKQLEKSYYQGRKKLRNKIEKKTNLWKFKYDGNKRDLMNRSKNTKKENCCYDYHSTRILLMSLTKGDKNKVKEFFNYLKYESKFSKFREKLLNLNLIHEMKEIFFTNLCKNCDRYHKIENLQNKTYSLMKKYTLHKIKTILKSSNRITRLMNLLKTFSMHKTISQLCLKKDIITQLSYQCKLSKLTRKKMSILYKSFYSTYLDTTFKMFGDAEQKREYEGVRKILIGENMINFKSANEEDENKTKFEHIHKDKDKL